MLRQRWLEPAKPSEFARLLFGENFEYKIHQFKCKFINLNAEEFPDFFKKRQFRDCLGGEELEDSRRVKVVNCI